jgi:hypothetical protein
MTYTDSLLNLFLVLQFGRISIHRVVTPYISSKEKEKKEKEKEDKIEESIRN